MRTCTAEALEPRIVRSAAVVHGVLLVNGTAGADVITVNWSYDSATNVQTLTLDVNGDVQSFTGAHAVGVTAGEGDDYVSIWMPGNLYAYVEGQGGNDTLESGAACRMYGGAGNDTLTGSWGRDRLYGNEGDDLIRGDRGKDFLYGGEGNDSMYGGAGSDRMWGDGGDDRILGNAGNDILFGQAGNDHLFGNDGLDRLEDSPGPNDINQLIE